MARAAKNAVVFILDVGIGMQSAPPGEPTPLTQATEIVSMLVQRKIFASSKDEVSLLLMGTEETNNPLFQEGEDSYSHISTAYEMAPANFDLLQYLSHTLKPGHAEADFLDALTIALDTLHSTCMKSKILECTIFLLTNFASDFNDEGVSNIMNAFRADGMDVELRIISPAFDDGLKSEDNADDEDEGFSAGREGAGPSSSSSRQPPNKMRRMNGSHNGSGKKQKTQRQLMAESLIRRMLAAGVNGMNYSFSEAVQAVMHFEKNKVRPSAWKVNLTLGNDLALPCVAYAKAKEAKQKQSWKKCHAKTHKVSDIVVDSYFYIDNDDKTEVQKDDVGKGYTYGQDIIPYGQTDEQQAKYQTEGKQLTILGFSQKKHVPVYLQVDDQAHVLMAEDGEGATGMYALAQAMHNKELVAICTYIYRKGSNPKLVALVPRIRNDYSVFVMVGLPFSEDFRPLSFPSLKKHLQKVTEKQEQAMEDVINSMFLTSSTDDGEVDGELYHPKEMMNPYFQRLYECLHHRSQHPDDDLPGPSTQVRAILEPDADVMEFAAQHIDKMKTHFNVEARVESKTTKSKDTWRKAALGETGKDEGQPSSLTTDTSNVTSIAHISVPKVTNVGTVTPDSDFIAILEHSSDSSQIDVAFEELQKTLDNIVSDPFASKYQNKIILCAKAMLSKATKYHKVVEVNCYMKDLKSRISSSNGELWRSIADSHINLISKKQSPDGASEQECNEFTADESGPGKSNEAEAEEVDDLLDMIE